MPDQHDIQRYLVRTLLAVGRCAEHAHDPDARDDITDACAALLDRWVVGGSSDRSAGIRSWCWDVDALLERLSGAGDVDTHVLLRARAQVLRLHAVCRVPATPREILPPSAKKKAHAREVASRTPTHDLGANQQRVLERIRSNPGMRTKDIIASFIDELSDRTVKRSLRELTDLGIMRRTKDGGVVAYTVVDVD